jgi:hypothetical protein
MYIELSGLRIQLDYDNGDWYATRAKPPAGVPRRCSGARSRASLKHSDAVAWFDLMNEPIVPTEVQQTWCRSTPRSDCFVQYLTKDPAGRPASR